MPYQDVDDIELVEPVHTPGVFARALRKMFVVDWGLKLLALGITLALWMAVADFNKPRTLRTAVQLNLVRPNNLNISNEPPKTVEVELTGSRENLRNLQFLDLVATVDITDNHAGERVVRLTTDRVQMELPTGVKIVSFRPATFPIRLEANLERQLPVEVKVEGQPAEGFELYRTSSQPNVVSVRGPASVVENLRQAQTETISIAGKKETFTVSKVAIDITDHKLELLTSTVDVTIEIGEKRIPATPPLSSASGSDMRLAARTKDYSQSLTSP